MKRFAIEWFLLANALAGDRLQAIDLLVELQVQNEINNKRRDDLKSLAEFEKDIEVAQRDSERAAQVPLSGLGAYREHHLAPARRMTNLSE